MWHGIFLKIPSYSCELVHVHLFTYSLASIIANNFVKIYHLDKEKW